MATILLTAARGPFALALARTFHAAGHCVLTCDPWWFTECRVSRCVHRHFRVPPPAGSPDAWTEEVVRICREHRVDLVVPTYEEALHLVRGLEGRADAPRVFASDFETILTLHDKWRFSQFVGSLGLLAPETELLTDEEQLAAAFRTCGGTDSVYKPVYSRFAAQIVVRPNSFDRLEKVRPTLQRPWVRQAFISGRPVCTYGVAHNGRVTAHAAYVADVSFPACPSMAYQRLHHPGALEWARTVIGELGYTGQFGFDFLENDAGLWAIECNPRMTGGFFLLKDDPAYVEAFFDPDAPLVEPRSDRAYVFRCGFPIYLAQRRLRWADRWRGVKLCLFGRSVMEARLRDPLPTLLFPFLVGAFALKALGALANPRILGTADNDWNGEPTPIPAQAAVMSLASIDAMR